MSFRQARIQWLLSSLYVRTLPDRIAGSFDESTISVIFALIVATGMFAKAREELGRVDAYVNSFSSFWQRPDTFDAIGAHIAAQVLAARDV